MCGISGMWNFKTGEPVDRGCVQRMTRLLAHRGPDGEGYHWESSAGLGHRRLSIIDVTGGAQPLCNENGTVWITFNGEIYNFPELRNDLLQRDHVFRTNSDTEAIVHLYEEYGVGCFEKLRGMFALGIWDGTRQQLVLARDRLGIKPLHYGFSHDGIVFASELKSIRESGKIDLTIDATAIADLFTYFYIPGPKTIYRNISSLEPGHWLAVSRNGVVKKQKYWDLDGTELHLRSEREYEDRLFNVLHESIKCHLLSDVPLGAFLSGGVDSSSVVALMAGLMSDPVRTYSIGFNEPAFNELPRARRVAQLFATDHHERIITPEPAKVLQQLFQYYDQPFADHSAIPTYYVSQLAREQVKVVLSGDGGDENFAGYERYKRHRLLEHVRAALPTPICWLLGRIPGDGSWTGTSLLGRTKKILQQLATDSREAYLRTVAITDAASRGNLFSSDLKGELGDYDPLNVFRDIYDRAPGSDPLSRMFYLDLKTYLVDDILTKVDRASMANSLEVRVPILDHLVVEFAHALPVHLKLGWGGTKYLLRNAISRRVPRSHLDLPKKGFAVPMAPWLRKDLRDWARNMVLGEPEVAAFLDMDAVRRLWDGFQRGVPNSSNLISVILSFTMSFPIWSTAPRAMVSTEQTCE